MQKRMVFSQWCFFKAGQGCFYAGQLLTRQSKPFTFVYDCGTTQGTAILKTEIREFKNHLAKEPESVIDLLVISHLDADHINLIDHLLKDCKCKIAVLPYLNPLNRLYLYFQAGFDDATDDDIFQLFIGDPAGFLIARGVEQVIFITGNDEDGVFSNNIGGPNSPDGNAENQEDEENGELFNMDVLMMSESDLSFRENWSFLYERPDSVQFRKANGCIRAGKFWEYFFYQIKQEPEKIKEFEDKVERCFGLTLENGQLRGSDLNEIFQQPTKVDAFKKAFKSIFKDTNSTGLIVMHGPINHYHTRFLTWRGDSDELSCYTLLSGDTDMHNGYPPYVLNRLHQLRVMQVPHHGSDKNWDTAQTTGLEDCNLVINYGTKNSYGHPGPAVIAEILSRSPSWQRSDNTELSSFCYQVMVYYSANRAHLEEAPFGRKHKPIITTSEYRTIDDPEHLGTRTDVRALSLGRSQWDREEFSVKAWRYPNGHWSQQSEEVPLHRALDMAILVISGMIEAATGTLPGHHLQPKVLQPDEMDNLKNFFKMRQGILDERLRELSVLVKMYLATR